MQLGEGAYYKLKARMLEANLQEAQIAKLQEMVLQKRQLAFREAGLDPAIPYEMDDDTLTITEKVSETATLEGAGK